MTPEAGRDDLWRHRDFRRLWAAQTISLVGTQITLLALPLTATLMLQASAGEMGLLQALALAPSLVVGLAAGVWLDRVRRRPVLIAADVGRAALLAAIPLAGLLGLLRIELLYVLAVLVGTLAVFFDVAHLSYLPTLVPRHRLAEGNSKLELSRSAAMIAGPSTGGLLVQALTAPVAILVDAVSFLGSALLLASIRAPEPAPAGHRDSPASFRADLLEGLRLVARQPLLRTMALSLCAYNLFAQWLAAIYVLYAVRDLGVTAGLLGLIFAAGGFAFSVGAMLAAPIGRRFGRGPAIAWGAGVCDAAFLLVPVAGAAHAAGWAGAVVPLLALAQIVAVLAGPVTSINQLSLRQAITPERLQGRVHATMRVIALGSGPLGALAGGFLGDAVGLQAAVTLGALGIQLGFVVLLFSPVREVREPALGPGDEPAATDHG